MWVVRDITTQTVTLDLSSSGQADRAVTQIATDGALFANAAELSVWGNTRVQVHICEHCGVEHRASGGWMVARNVGAGVAFVPAFDEMATGDWERVEYAPAHFAQGAPVFRQSDGEKTRTSPHPITTTTRPTNNPAVPSRRRPRVGIINTVSNQLRRASSSSSNYCIAQRLYARPDPAHQPKQTVPSQTGSQTKDMTNTRRYGADVTAEAPAPIVPRGVSVPVGLCPKLNPELGRLPARSVKRSVSLRSTSTPHRWRIAC